MFTDGASLGAGAGAGAEAGPGDGVNSHSAAKSQQSNFTNIPFNFYLPKGGEFNVYFELTGKGRYNQLSTSFERSTDINLKVGSDIDTITVKIGGIFSRTYKAPFKNFGFFELKPNGTVYTSDYGYASKKAIELSDDGIVPDAKSEEINDKKSEKSEKIKCEYENLIHDNGDGTGYIEIDPNIAYTVFNVSVNKYMPKYYFRGDVANLRDIEKVRKVLNDLNNETVWAETGIAPHHW